MIHVILILDYDAMLLIIALLGSLEFPRKFWHEFFTSHEVHLDLVRFILVKTRSKEGSLRALDCCLHSLLMKTMVECACLYLAIRSITRSLTFDSTLLVL